MYNTYELDHNIEMMNKLSAVLENIQLECDYLTMTEAVEGESSETTEKKESLLKVAGKAIGKWIEKAWNAIQQLIENIAIRMRGGDKAVAREDVRVTPLVKKARTILVPILRGTPTEFNKLESKIREKELIRKGEKIELKDIYSNLNILKKSLSDLKRDMSRIKDDMVVAKMNLFKIAVMSIISDSKLLLSKSISSDRLEKIDNRAAKKNENKSNRESKKIENEFYKGVKQATKKANKASKSKKEAMQEAVDLLYEKAVLCEDAAEAEGYIQKAEELQKAVDSIPEEKPETMDNYNYDVNGGEGEELDHEEIKDLCDGDEEVVKLLTDDEDKSVTVDSSSNNESALDFFNLEY